MLKGKVVTLRPVEEEDLPVLYEYILDIENRGEFYPRHIQTLTELRKEFHEHGFWKDDFGLFVLVDNDSQKIIGTIFWFKIKSYLTELELGYIMYDSTSRSRGGTTEAVKLFTRYLFDTMQINRIRLCIATENRPSRRVAEKSGYKHEGTQRGAWWNLGRFYDMELYAVTRDDLSPA
ncbi:MAG: GNAT family N-acetyltransferase [Chloroflexi bacterium]|nr:GNAT family N-acetyltransferase [Chloroflexota bacterium]